MEIESRIEIILSNVLSILADINNYEIPDMPSLRKTIDPFSPILIYDKVIDFFIEKTHEISRMDEIIMDNTDSRIDISYRLKTEQSFLAKWEKNLGNAMQLREVCNDIIGIRFIVESTAEEMFKEISKVVEY